MNDWSWFIYWFNWLAKIRIINHIHSQLFRLLRLAYFCISTILFCVFNNFFSISLFYFLRFWHFIWYSSSVWLVLKYISAKEVGNMQELFLLVWWRGIFWLLFLVSYAKEADKWGILVEFITKSFSLWWFAFLIVFDPPFYNWDLWDNLLVL